MHDKSSSRQADIDELIALKADIKALVELLKQVRVAFSLFIAVGRACKWLASSLAVMIAIYYLIVKRDSSLLTAIFRSEP